MNKSPLMEGLLWAEDYIDKGVFFEDDPSGIETLNWELYYSGEFSDEYTFDSEWFSGAESYLEHLKYLEGSVDENM